MKVEYYVTNSGRKPVEDFIFKQPSKARVAIVNSIEMLQKYGIIKLLQTRHLEKVKAHQLYELKSNYGKDQYRILGDEIADTFWLFNAFRKKDQKLRLKEIETAKRRKITMKS